MNKQNMPDVKTARQIPVSRYVSTEWEALESERLWTKVWQIACTTDCVPEAGDYWTYDIGKLSIIILRDEVGELQAFQNVCQHRGTRLLDGSSSNSDTPRVHIQCPYHGWAYNLRGHRCTVSEAGEIGDARPGTSGLIRVAVDTWGGFVFVNLDTDCEPLAEFLEQLPEELSWVGMDEFSCDYFLSFRIECNWKVAVDAFIETYHLHVVHPQMTCIADDVNSPITLFDKHTMFMQPYGVPSPRREGTVTDQELWEEYVNTFGHRLGMGYDASYESAGPHPDVPEGKTIRDVLIEKLRAHLATMGSHYDNLDDSRVIDDFHYHIFPNAVFNIFAGFYGLILARPGPNPDECIFDMWNFELRPEGASDQHPVPKVLNLSGDETRALGPVVTQDLDLLPRVQRGLHQPGITLTKLVAAEARIGRMHEILDRLIMPPEDQRLPE